MNETTDLICLPENPSLVSTPEIVQACERVFQNRLFIIENIETENAIEAMRRAGAIERYLRTKEHKDCAQRAARVLETAVGEALGPAEHGGDRGNQHTGGKSLASNLPKVDAHRFRRMAQHRELWWPTLNEKAISRKEALRIIDRILQQSDDPGETCTIDDLNELISRGEKFGTIYIDPPWRYDNQGTRGATRDHYKADEENPADGMTVEQIEALPIDLLAAKDSHLHLWTTNAFLFDCKRLFDAWGFEFKSSFVWCKPTIGTGNYWRNAHEILLTAIRGDAKSFADKSIRSWVECGRGQHSAKPEQVRHFIERASPGKRIELFARHDAEGWTVWGNDIQRTLFSRSAA